MQQRQRHRGAAQGSSHLNWNDRRSLGKYVLARALPFDRLSTLTVSYLCERKGALGRGRAAAIDGGHPSSRCRRQLQDPLPPLGHGQADCRDRSRRRRPRDGTVATENCRAPSRVPKVPADVGEQRLCIGAARRRGGSAGEGGAAQSCTREGVRSNVRIVHVRHNTTCPHSLDGVGYGPLQLAAVGADGSVVADRCKHKQGRGWRSGAPAAALPFDEAD